MKNGSVWFALFVFLICTPVYASNNLTYRAHVSNIGWMDEVSSPGTCGTTGQGQNMEALEITSDASFTLQAHVSDIGWMDPESNRCGTTGEGKALEAVRIRSNTEGVDVYYRSHVRDYGWLDWVKNFDSSGTEGLAKPIEALEIVLVAAGGEAPGDTDCGFLYKDMPPVETSEFYQSGFDWKSGTFDDYYVGLTGKAAPLQSFRLSVHTTVLGAIEYKSHISDIGWEENFTSDYSGQIGKNIEAVKLQLIGPLSLDYDLYYQVHVQDLGWLGYAKNGESAGTTGVAKPVEAINVVLQKKGEPTPQSDKEAFLQPISREEFYELIQGCYLEEDGTEDRVVGISETYIYTGDFEGYYEVLNADKYFSKIRLVDRKTNEAITVDLDQTNIRGGDLKLTAGGVTRNLKVGRTIDRLNYSFSNIPGKEFSLKFRP